MDASSSKKPKSEPPTLTSLPEDLILRIIVTATRKECGFFRVAGLSKQLRRLCEDPSVLRSVGYRMIERSIETSASNRERLFQGCLESGEPHAQFVQGKADYFLNRRKGIWLKLLISSASQEHQRATYVCGILLLCLGGPDRQNGLNMLYSLMHPSSVYESMIIVGDLHSVYESMIIVGDLHQESDLRWWHARYVADTFRELKQSYVRDPCRCNGKTTTFVEMGASKRYRKVTRGKDLSASEACLICFWDNQVQRFVYGYV